MTKGGKATGAIDVPVRNTTLIEGIFNMAKSAVGTGTLVLAFAMHQMGLVLGVSMLLLSAVLASISLHFLGRVSANTDCGSYFQLGRLALGPTGEYSALVALAIFLMGGLIFYASIIGDYLSKSLIFMTGLPNDSWYLSVTFLNVVAGVLFVFPLSCLKDMSALAKTSIAGMACMLYVAGLTVVDFFIGRGSRAPVTIRLYNLDSSFFTVFSNFLFAYMNHFTIVSIVPVMVNPTPARRSILIIASAFFTTLIYLLVAIFGYLHFGQGILGPKDILTAGGASWAYAIAQFAVAVVIIFSFPLLADPARAGFDQIFTLITGGSSKGSSMIRHYSITAIIVAVSLIISITCKDVVLTILNVFTALCGSLLMFIFPALYFLRLSPRYPVSIIERILAYVNIVFGTVILIFGTISGVKDLFV